MFKETIFSIMNGEWEVGTEPALEAIVQNEFDFGKDSVCAKQYNRIYNAQLHLAERLGGRDEDEDILTIVEECEIIIQHVCFKAYDYGTRHPKLPVSYGFMDKKPFFRYDAGYDTTFTEPVEAWGNVSEAVSHLKRRLDADGTDFDIQAILKGYQFILYYLARKMCGYGAYFKNDSTFISALME